MEYFQRPQYQLVIENLWWCLVRCVWFVLEKVPIHKGNKYRFRWIDQVLYRHSCIAYKVIQIPRMTERIISATRMHLVSHVSKLKMIIITLSLQFKQNALMIEKDTQQIQFEIAEAYCKWSTIPTQRKLWWYMSEFDWIPKQIWNMNIFLLNIFFFRI